MTMLHALTIRIFVPEGFNDAALDGMQQRVSDACDDINFEAIVEQKLQEHSCQFPYTIDVEN